MAENESTSFGSLLRRFRLAASLSQEALAERAGLSANAIAALERGRRTAPRPDTVTLLAGALALPPADRAAFIAAALGASAPEAMQPPADFPPLLSPQAPRHNLPEALTPMIGREAEQVEVLALLAGGRLVTLTGTGGAGKTRLALAVAAELVDQYPDGVWLVELAALSEPTLVPQAVATILGLREDPGRPLLTTLTGYLRGKHLLLVLDNCEHLIGACAELAAALLRRCPTLHILATSREALDVTGEQRYWVPSLSVPDLNLLPPPDRLGEYQAVALFLARARERRPDFAITIQNARAVAQVCARLDGIPLAIELAAARVSALPVEAIAARLDDRFRLLTGGPRTAVPRQQTLRGALDWSYDLLSEPEQVLLHRLTVFAGSWTLEAAEAICAGDGAESWEVMDLLGTLVNKSLVLVEQREQEARYGLLETVRQYGREKLLAADAAAEVATRHLDWYLALAEQGEPLLTGPEQRAWLARLEVEHDNLRAAMHWVLEDEHTADSTLVTPTMQARVARGLRLSGALWRFWYTRGYVTEGRGWLEVLLGRDAGAAPAPVRARALHGAGVLATSQGDYEAARTRCEQSLALYRELGDKHGAAGALNILGHVAEKQGDPARAVSLMEESLALHRELGATRGIAVALNNLGTLLLSQGDYDQAGDLFTESLSLNRELGDSRGVAIALTNLGEVARCRHDYAQAAALCAESLALARELGDTWGIAAALNTLGDAARDQGDYARAMPFYQECLALREELGDKAGIAVLRDTLAQMMQDQDTHERTTNPAPVSQGA